MSTPIVLAAKSWRPVVSWLVGTNLGTFVLVGALTYCVVRGQVRGEYEDKLADVRRQSDQQIADIRRGYADKIEELKVVVLTAMLGHSGTDGKLSSATGPLLSGPLPSRSGSPDSALAPDDSSQVHLAESLKDLTQQLSKIVEGVRTDAAREQESLQKRAAEDARRHDDQNKATRAELEKANQRADSAQAETEKANKRADSAETEKQRLQQQLTTEEQLLEGRRVALEQEKAQLKGQCEQIAADLQNTRTVVAAATKRGDSLYELADVLQRELEATRMQGVSGTVGSVLGDGVKVVGSLVKSVATLDPGAHPADRDKQFRRQLDELRNGAKDQQ